MYIWVKQKKKDETPTPFSSVTEWYHKIREASQLARARFPHILYRPRMEIKKKN